MSKIDHSLFKAGEHALEAFGPCPECSADLKLKHSKSGPFIGCSNYPDCHYTKPLHEHETATVKLIEDSECPECGNQLAIKKGKFGLFIGCSNYPQCHHIESTKQQADTHLTCPQCHEGKLTKRANRFGKNFYACDHYPQCRYAVNHPPVEKQCPACGWEIMLERKGANGHYWQCPQKPCQHKVQEGDE